MSDQRLRELEREAVSGDHEAAEELVRLLTRAKGEVPPMGYLLAHCRPKRKQHLLTPWCQDWVARATLTAEGREHDQELPTACGVSAPALGGTWIAGPGLREDWAAHNVCGRCARSAADNHRLWQYQIAWAIEVGGPEYPLLFALDLDRTLDLVQFELLNVEGITRSYGP